MTNTITKEAKIIATRKADGRSYTEAEFDMMARHGGCIVDTLDGKVIGVYESLKHAYEALGYEIMNVDHIRNDYETLMVTIAGVTGITIQGVNYFIRIVDKY